MNIQVRRLLSAAEKTAYRILHNSSVDLAVTGLSEAGKTVFITSLIHNLLCGNKSSGNNERSLDGFKPVAEGTLSHVALPPAGSQRRPLFPFGDCLKALASDATWPKRTGATSEIEVKFRFSGKRPMN